MEKKENYYAEFLNNEDLPIRPISNHGGKRPGAGRPKELEDPKDMGLTLDKPTRDILAKAAEVYGSASAAVRAWAKDWSVGKSDS